jgi:hypothetical protein
MYFNIHAPLGAWGLQVFFIEFSVLLVLVIYSIHFIYHASCQHLRKIPFLISISRTSNMTCMPTKRIADADTKNMIPGTKLLAMPS